MSAFDDLYRQQPAHEWYRAEQAERADMYDEAEERGVSVQQVAHERERADAEWRKSEAERVAAIVNDPVLLRQLKAYWAPREIAPDGTVAPRLPNPLAPPPEPPTREGPLSSGRQISPPRQRY